MFRVGLLFIIRRCYSVYTEIGVCHVKIMELFKITYIYMYIYISVAVYTEQYLLLMSSKPARKCRG